MAGAPTLQVEGIEELRAALKRMGEGAQEQLIEVQKQAAKVYQAEARPRVPVKTGAARKSIRVVFAADRMTFTGGGTKVPYFRWLDYGGWVGKNPAKARTASTEHQVRRRNSGSQGSVHRPHVKEGRIIYPAYFAAYDQVMDLMNEGIRALAEEHGLEVSGG